MANNVIDWAYKFTFPHHLEKFVLVTLADDATKAGTCYYVGSMKTLGALCNISERQARRSVRKLETYGIVITSPQERRNGSATTNIYQLRITIEPEVWNAEHSRGGKVSKTHERYYVNFDEKRFFEILKAQSNEQTFTTWLQPCQVIRAEKRGRLIIRVPNPYFVGYLSDYKTELLAAAQEIEKSITSIHLIADRPPDL